MPASVCDAVQRDHAELVPAVCEGSEGEVEMSQNGDGQDVSHVVSGVAFPACSLGTLTREVTCLKSLERSRLLALQRLLWEGVS